VFAPACKPAPHGARIGLVGHAFHAGMLPERREAYSPMCG